MAIPKHYIYASDGSTLLYTIQNVTKREPPIALAVPRIIELSNLRGSGSINIPGGNQSYDITIDARIGGTDYAGIMSALASLESGIPINTNLYLKYDKTLINNESLEAIKVMRVQPFIIDTTRGNLRTFVYYTIILKALAW